MTVPNRWQHQEQALDFVDGKDAAMLAMGMGTGKSRVVVDLVARKGHKRTLIVCPKAMVEQWPQEFEKYATDPVWIWPIRGKRDLYPMTDEYPRVWVINYELFWREPYKSWVKKQNFDLIVYDESQKIKSPGGKAAKFAHTLAKVIPYRMALTGTPLHDTPLDAYSQFKALDPDVFGTAVKGFRDRYIEFDPDGPWVPYVGPVKVKGYKNQDEFAAKFHSLAFSVETEDVLDLPPITFSDRRTDLPAAAKKLYKTLDRDFVANFGWDPEVEEPVLDGQGNWIVADNVLVKLLRLQQLAGGYAVDEFGEETRVHAAKENLLAEVLEEIGPEEKVVVFGVFKSDLRAIRRAAEDADRDYLEQSGRRHDWSYFQKLGPQGAVIGVQMKSGSAGIDLTTARYGIFYSSGFSRGDYKQAIRRLHRPGQGRHTHIVRLGVRETVDDHVYSVLEGKEDVVSQMLRRSNDSVAA